MHFLVRDAPRLLEEARTALGAFVGAEPDDLAFVPNATDGRQRRRALATFAPGDELFTTDHGYDACKNALDYVADADGRARRRGEGPVSARAEDEVVSAVSRP